MRPVADPGTASQRGARKDPLEGFKAEASCFNQLAMSVVQITLNNTLRSYGAVSVYGSDIPLACVGVISKVNVLFMAFVLGTAQGCQPILGFNYGAKNYARVRETYEKAAIAVTTICVLSFLCFQLFPRQIVFLVPLLLILPMFYGIDGVMYAGPIADAAALILATYFAWREMNRMRTLEMQAEA